MLRKGFRDVYNTFRSGDPIRIGTGLAISATTYTILYVIFSPYEDWAHENIGKRIIPSSLLRRYEEGVQAANAAKKTRDDGHVTDRI